MIFPKPDFPQADTLKERYQKIGDTKRSTPIEVLSENFPGNRDFLFISVYCRSMKPFAEGTVLSRVSTHSHVSGLLVCTLYVLLCVSTRPVFLAREFQAPMGAYPVQYSTVDEHCTVLLKLPQPVAIGVLQ